MITKVRNTSPNGGAVRVSGLVKKQGLFRRARIIKFGEEVDLTTEFTHEELLVAQPSLQRCVDSKWLTIVQ